MAYCNPSSQLPSSPRRTSSRPDSVRDSAAARIPTPVKPSQARRSQKRAVRDEVLRLELERREHSPYREPEHAPRRKTKARFPFWKIVRRAAFVLVFFGICELAVAALTAQQFQVKSLNVTGCTITDSDAVLEMAQPLVGQNFIRAKTSSIEQKIEAIPTVADAHVSRVLDWPPRLHVEVIERQAFARVGAGENWWVVDQNGMAFRRANSEGEDAKLYAITGPKFAPKIGETLTSKQWNSAVEITKSVQSDAASHDWALRRIYFDKDGSVSLRLTGGFNDETLVRLGGDHWNEKLVRARQALEYFQRTNRRAAVLNLVSYEMPQWTPRSPSQASNSASTPSDAEPVADTASET